jgi:hypothetical protein
MTPFPFKITTRTRQLSVPSNTEHQHNPDVQLSEDTLRATCSQRFHRKRNTLLTMLSNFNYKIDKKQHRKQRTNSFHIRLYHSTNAVCILLNCYIKRPIFPASISSIQGNELFNLHLTSRKEGNEPTNFSTVQTKREH